MSLGEGIAYTFLGGLGAFLEEIKVIAQPVGLITALFCGIFACILNQILWNKTSKDVKIRQGEQDGK